MWTERNFTMYFRSLYDSGNKHYICIYSNVLIHYTHVPLFSQLMRTPKDENSSYYFLPRASLCALTTQANDKIEWQGYYAEHRMATK